MTTRKITIIALIAGIVLGAAATEAFNVYRQFRDSRVFQERLRCRAVADDYVKENSTDEKNTDRSGSFLTLNKVDYSPGRNSCVADLVKDRYFPNAHGPSPISVSINRLHLPQRPENSPHPTVTSWEDVKLALPAHAPCCARRRLSVFRSSPKAISLRRL